MNNKGIAIVPIVVIIAAVLAFSATGYFFYSTFKNTNESADSGTVVVNVNTNSAAVANENTNAVVNANVNTNSNVNGNVNASTDATKDWKTYDDTKYDFSVRYPLSWNTKLYTTGYNNEGPYVVVFTPSNPPGPLPFISIRENWTVKQEVDRINALDPGISRVTSQVERSINGIKGTEITYSTAIGSTPKSFIVVQGNTTLIFNAVPNQTDWEVVIGTLVSTTTSDPTAGWKTYTNTQYHYAFKYPADWSLVEYTYDGSPMSYDYVWVKERQNDDVSFMVCPDQRSGDCAPFQDAQWDNVTSNVVVDGKEGIRTSYTLASGQTCTTCTPRSTITLSQRPTGWTGGRDFLLRPGAENSTIPDTILSTFTFTK